MIDRKTNEWHEGKVDIKRQKHVRRKMNRKENIFSALLKNV